MCPHKLKLLLKVQAVIFPCRLDFKGSQFVQPYFKQLVELQVIELTA